SGRVIQHRETADARRLPILSDRSAAILPRKPHRVARRIGCDAEALLPGACRGVGDIHNGLPNSAPLVQCAARSVRRSFSAPLVPPPIALSGFPPPKQRSRSDTSVAGKYPIATYSPPPTPAPDTQKPQPPRECGDCGIAQTRAQHRPQATAARGGNPRPQPGISPRGAPPLPHFTT